MCLLLIYKLILLQINLKVNNFVSIEKLEDFSFSKVKYYSVKIQDNDENEFYNFIRRMNEKNEIQDDFEKLFVWLEEIGDREGAKERFFRHEGAANALPPEAYLMKAHRIKLDGGLRLYCFRLDEKVVFLFNGDIKTAQKAQDCPNVGKYFKQANRFAIAIDKLIKENEIVWTSDSSNIIFDSDLTF